MSSFLASLSFDASLEATRRNFPFGSASPSARRQVTARIIVQRTIVRCDAMKVRRLRNGAGDMRTRDSDERHA